MFTTSKLAKFFGFFMHGKLVCATEKQKEMMNCDSSHNLYEVNFDNQANFGYSAFYMMEISFPEGLLEAQLSPAYITNNEGVIISEFFFKPKGGRVCKRMFFFNRKCNRVFIDLLLQKDDIHKVSISFKLLTKSFVKSRVVSRLTSRHPEFQSSIHNFNALWRLYNASFPTPPGKGNYDYWLNFVERNENIKTKNTISFKIIVFISNISSARATLLSIKSQGYKKYDLYCCFLDKNNNESVMFDGYPVISSIKEIEELSDKQYLLLIDDNTNIAKNALAHLVGYLESSEPYQLLYFDSDYLENGKRVSPCFKPEWNVDLLYSHNYIGNFFALSREGLLKLNINFNNLYHLLLLASDRIEKKFIKRIPLVLSHQRFDYDVGVESKETLNNYLTAKFQKNAPSISDGLVDGSHRVEWPRPFLAPKVTLIIPTRDKVDLLENAISSIVQHTDYPNYEIVIVDNESVNQCTHNYLQMIVNIYDHIKVISYNGEFNFSAMNNYAAKQTSSEVIAMLNNDIEVINNGWFSEMVSQCMRDDIGCVGAKLYYKNDVVQHAGVILGIGDIAGHAHRFFPRSSSGYCNRLMLTQNFSAVTAACLFVKRSIFEQVGGFDQDNLKVAYNDVDFCLKVQRLGYRNLWTPYAQLYHYESASRGQDDTPEKQERYNKEVAYMKEVWQQTLQSDPFYNPNLNQNAEDFSYGFF